jgi:hypothetical protein
MPSGAKRSLGPFVNPGPPKAADGFPWQLKYRFRNERANGTATNPAAVQS